MSGCYEVEVSRWQLTRWGVAAVFERLPWYRWPRGLWAVVRIVWGSK